MSNPQFHQLHPRLEEALAELSKGKQITVVARAYNIPRSSLKGYYKRRFIYKSLPPPAVQIIPNSCGACAQTLTADILQCSSCHKSYHISCLRLPEVLAGKLKSESVWQCGECKTCSLCKSPEDQANMVLCDGCDRGYHIFCLKPALPQLPSGDWFCSHCTKPESPRFIRSRKNSHSSPIAGTSSCKIDSLNLTPTYSPMRTTKRKLLASPIAMPNISPKRKTRKIEDKESCIKSEEIVKEENIGVEERNEPTLTQMSSMEHIEMFNKAREVAQLKQEELSSLLPVTNLGTPVVILGKYSMVAANVAPYPPQFSGLKYLFLCEFCLKPHEQATILKRHSAKCVLKHPPGNEIYRHDAISVWEVDGKTMKAYSQNLCLLSKMFLGHKTLYFDVDPFIFYILTVADTQGCHIVGYFSKEKESMMNYNLSCLLTLPPYQRKGYGHMLIQFSYLLSIVEKRIGSPEHPLSDMGLMTYRNYWRDTILIYLLAHQTAQNMSAETGIHVNDLMSTLQWMGMVKNWKGHYYIYTRPELLKEAKVRAKKLNGKLMSKKRLLWIPFHERKSHLSSP